VIVWVVGRPVADSENSTTIGWVDPTGPAWKAGLRPGDQILEIQGHHVDSVFAPIAGQCYVRIITSEGSTFPIKYLRDGKEYTVEVTPYKRPTQWYERRALRQVLIAPAHKAVIYDVATNSPAALAGLQRGDEVVAMNGAKVFSFMPVVYEEETMTNGVIKPITLTIRRGSETFDRSLVAEKPLKPVKSGPSFGITAWQGVTNITLSHPDPFQQISASAGQIFATIGTVFSHKSDVSVQQLGGAVMIIRLYSNLFESEHGWRQVLWFSVILNVNLALLNLLPFPVLDGRPHHFGLFRSHPPPPRQRKGAAISAECLCGRADRLHVVYCLSTTPATGCAAREATAKNPSCSLPRANRFQLRCWCRNHVLLSVHLFLSAAENP